MKKNPLISVIIPTYNRAWVLAEAIDSVLAQDYKNFELIVVDDGSTDNTSDLLDTYSNKLKPIRQINAGVSAARNRGIVEALGDFLAFLDSDDTWLPQKLSRQMDFFIRRPEALICQTQEIWIRNNVRVNPRKYHKKPSGMIFEPSLDLCLVSPSAVMIKKELFKDIGCFDESLPACEDYDLWLRVGCRYPIYLANDPLVIKRGGHPDQLSRAPGLDRFRVQALHKILQNGQLTASQSKAAIAVLQKKCTIYAAGCRKRGRPDEASYYTRLADSYPVM
ncbi:MAG: glycosyltransferase [Deltaproteobacteria bacterium]|nr:glycosyltransferase [Deltaproteobacteria bacterium]